MSVAANQRGEFSAVFEDFRVMPDFVLKSDGVPVYILSPQIGDAGPSATPVEGDEILQRPGQLLIEEGEALKFELPSDLNAGEYELCSSADECILVKVG